MKEKRPCKSIFMGDRSETTTEDVTRMWIILINRMEQSKAALSTVTWNK